MRWLQRLVRQLELHHAGRPRVDRSVDLPGTLASPWLDWSWGSTNIFNSTTHVDSGSAALKLVQTSWGGLIVHSGPSGAAISINPDRTPEQFAVYNTNRRIESEPLPGNDQGRFVPHNKLISCPRR